MNARVAWLFSAIVSMGVLLGTMAHAEPNEAPPPGSKRVAARAALGLGAGSAGVGGRAAISGTVWPSDFFGATLEYQSAGDGALFGPSESFELLSAGASFRTRPNRFYAQFDVLVGGGRGHSTEASASIFGPPAPRREFSGPALTLVASAYFHPSVVELGPTLAVTAYGDADIVTFGFACGLAF